jgi:hypothetical protein
MFGLINNPSFKRIESDRILVAHYQGLVGKAGMDNTNGWVATVDGTAGYVFIERFEYQKSKQYPDDTSATFWLNGAGQIVCGTNLVTITEADIADAHLVESEILSPMAGLRPGESYSFHNEWAVANIGGDYPIHDCSAVGVICGPRPLHELGRAEGRFGVFYSGTAEVVVNGKTEKSIPVSPTQPLILQIPRSNRNFIVVIKDKNGKVLGELPRWRLGC